MYDTQQLKETIRITDDSVECPVKDCSVVVAKARRGEPLRQLKFLCPEHGIYITPSTFEYADELDNLLWRDTDDRELLNTIKGFKRESRLARDNSEDALTWNVFRYFERSHTLDEFLTSLTGSAVRHANVGYWSYSRRGEGVVESLERARSEFGEATGRGSEPDLIIEAEDVLIWVEAKLGSTNETTPSNPEDTKKYVSGGNGWFGQAFVSDFASVAVAAKRYELTRLWLLGSWAANQEDKRFVLLNLVGVNGREDVFRAHIRPLPHAALAIATWEQAHDWLVQHRDGDIDAQKLINYLREKSAGYVNGRLRTAFARPQTGTV